MFDSNFWQRVIVSGTSVLLFPFHYAGHAIAEFGSPNTESQEIVATVIPTPSPVEDLMMTQAATSQPENTQLLASNGSVLGASQQTDTLRATTYSTPTPTRRRKRLVNPKPSPSLVPTPTPTPTPKVTPTPTATPMPTPTQTPVSQTPDFSALPRQWGAYAGYVPTDTTTFEQLVGKPMNIVATFVHWGNERDFPTEYASVAKNKGKSLLIFWEAKDYRVSSVNQPNYNYDSILSGTWDAYFKQFALDAKAYGGDVILVPFDEMNGDWSPWSGTLNGNTPQKYVAAYRYVRKFFTDATNVKFGWAVNNDSVPDTEANKFENYYPGDEYVDYVGVDGFNFNDGEWETWNQVFDESIARLEKYPKPIYIFSTASAPGADKAQWIADGFEVQFRKHRNLVGFIWFNENKEHDWRVNSDAASLNAFKQVISGL